MKNIKIANKAIGINKAPFLIAEAGINHNGSLDQALKMIEAAKKAKVDAVKFQTYKTEELISDSKQTYTYISAEKKINEYNVGPKDGVKVSEIAEIFLGYFRPP